MNCEARVFKSLDPAFPKFGSYPANAAETKWFDTENEARQYAGLPLAKVKKRIWKPQFPSPPAYSSSVVDHWEWTLGSGLKVAYKDDPKRLFRSDWKTLLGFLRAIREGREKAYEVK